MLSNQANVSQIFVLFVKVLSRIFIFNGPIFYVFLSLVSIYREQRPKSVVYS